MKKLKVMGGLPLIGYQNHYFRHCILHLFEYFNYICNMDDIKKVDRDMDAEKQKTQIKKEKFIRDIKGGLGNHIKRNGGVVKKIKKSRFKVFWGRLMNMF